MKITHRREDELPGLAAGGTVNEELQLLRTEMSKLAASMVLEVDGGSTKLAPATAHEVNSAASRTDPLSHLPTPWWWFYIRSWRARMWVETGHWS